MIVRIPPISICSFSFLCLPCFDRAIIGGASSAVGFGQHERVRRSICRAPFRIPTLIYESRSATPRILLRCGPARPSLAAHTPHPCIRPAPASQARGLDCDAPASCLAAAQPAHPCAVVRSFDEILYLVEKTWQAVMAACALGAVGVWISIGSHERSAGATATARSIAASETVSKAQVFRFRETRFAQADKNHDDALEADELALFVNAISQSDQRWSK